MRTTMPRAGRLRSLGRASLALVTTFVLSGSAFAQTPPSPTPSPRPSSEPAPQPVPSAPQGSQPQGTQPQGTQPQGTQPEGTQGQGAQAAAPKGRVFDGDAGIIFNQIKPDKTADFERVIARLREALEKSDDPVRRQQAAGWRVFKSVEPGPNGTVLYLFWVNPAVKGEDYTVSRILAEVFPQEAQELYQAYAGAYASGQNLLNLQLVAELGGQQAPPAAAQQD